MTDEILTEMKNVNEQESLIREKKFKIMRVLGVISWEQAQSEAIKFMEEKRNVNT